MGHKNNRYSLAIEARLKKEEVMNKFRRSGFTLIEVLIVVVIMAVLAATIIPQFSASTDDAKDSSLRFNMHTLRSQIELYKIHHNTYPAISDGKLPQLTSATNAGGTVGTGDSFPYGPYIADELPGNPYNNNDNTVVAGDGSAVVEGGAGWQYNAATGGIWPNSTEYFAE